jgi:peptidoglycan-associated lipoprotein
MKDEDEMKRLTAVLLVATVAVACTKNQKPLEPASGSSLQGAAPSEPTALDDDASGKSQIVIAESIREACGIADAEAFFEYDSARVSTAGEAVLKRLADCFSAGPLKGEEMRLVGHADARGSDEYNMALGSRRAESVKKALVAFGLCASVVTTTSRGEMESTGTDMDTWPHDRRVDVTIGG